MPTPLNTTLDQILLEAKKRLVSAGIFSPTLIFLATNPDQLEFPGSDQFCVIAPGKQVVNEHVRIGGGRDIYLFDGQMTCTLHSRLLLDEVPRDDIFLTDGHLGVIRLCNCVVNTLEQYQPVDKDGNQLLPIGYELVSIDTYARKPENAGWGSLVATWRFEYSYILGC